MPSALAILVVPHQAYSRQKFLRSLGGGGFRDDRIEWLGLIAPSRHGSPSFGADGYFNAVCKGDMFFSQLVGPTLGRVAILDARGRSPHVHPGRPLIVGPRGRGSLPRLPAFGRPTPAPTPAAAALFRRRSRR